MLWGAALTMIANFLNGGVGVNHVSDLEGKVSRCFWGFRSLEIFFDCLYI